MSLQHKNTVLGSNSPYIDRNDPASRRKLEVGDQVTICTKRSEAFLTSSLSASANRCPFCQELLSNEKLPLSSSSSQHPKKPAVSKDRKAPTYEENRRTNWGWLATLGTGGIFLVVLLCVVGAVIVFAINSGNSSNAYEPDQESYPVQKSQPTSVQSEPRNTKIPSKTPRPKPTRTSAPQNIGYAEISGEIYFAALRRSPGYKGKNDQKDVIEEVPSGSTVTILDGPETADGISWWYVEWNGYEGWMAERTGSGKKILIFSP